MKKILIVLLTLVSLCSVASDRCDISVSSWMFDLMSKKHQKKALRLLDHKGYQFVGLRADDFNDTSELHIKFYGIEAILTAHAGIDLVFGDELIQPLDQEFAFSSPSKALLNGFKELKYCDDL
ncbi:MAG: hypothetical protein N4A33_05940 [Bacteriovoracaceae bacterium]|nr:hypothetical protein [Bacteriovoracaceae bacterium]